jgi:hypothetical protein
MASGLLKPHSVTVSCLTLALMISAAAASVQHGIQSLPNMGQQITPLMPQGSVFQPLNPGLSDFLNWLASNAVTTVVSPLHDNLLVLTSGYNRVYKNLLAPVTGSRRGICRTPVSMCSVTTFRPRRPF